MFEISCRGLFRIMIHEVIVWYAKTPPLNSHAEVLAKLDLSLYLHSYCAYASCKGSGESAHYDMLTPLLIYNAKVPNYHGTAVSVL